MSADSDKRLDTVRASASPECKEAGLLLVRAPSDREIYGAFRALASRWRDQPIAERLVIEGNVPITPGLTSPAVPAGLQRLLDADCEMIDVLALEARDITITYLRTGGHAPFRESFFDELRVQVRDGAVPSTHELEAIFSIVLSHLGVVSHSATSPFADIIADLIAKGPSTSEMPPSEASGPFSRRP